MNAFAALDYLAKNLMPDDPEIIATIGCSAGSLGGIINAPYLMSRYKKSAGRTFYFGDSYVGVITSQQFKEGVKNWDLQFSPAVPGLDPVGIARVTANSSINPGAYIINATLSAFPGSQFSSYTSNNDAVQVCNTSDSSFSLE